MIRIEIIANHSVEENIMEALAKEKVGRYYTKIPGILGVGSSGPRMGDPIWPEENFVMIIWCDLNEARGIERAVKKVKNQFPGEGIKLFGMPPREEEFIEGLPSEGPPSEGVAPGPPLSEASPPEQLSPPEPPPPEQVSPEAIGPADSQPGI